MKEKVRIRSQSVTNLTLSAVFRKLYYNIAGLHTLKILAALVWYSGAVVLSYKSSRLLSQAHGLNAEQLWIWLAIFAGIIIGLLKAKYLFKQVCIKNLKRIYALKAPQLRQFYRTHFYFFLLSSSDGFWKPPYDNKR